MVVYTVVVGEAAGLWTRQIDALSVPPPEQESSVKRSPVSGSIEIVVGQVKFEAVVAITLPLDGLICSTAPVEEPPVVSSRLTNRCPLWSNASPASVKPNEVPLSGVPDTRLQPGRELVDVSGREVVDVEVSARVSNPRPAAPWQPKFTVLGNYGLRVETGGIRSKDESRCRGQIPNTAVVTRDAEEAHLICAGTRWGESEIAISYVYRSISDCLGD